MQLQRGSVPENRRRSQKVGEVEEPSGARLALPLRRDKHWLRYSVA